MLTSSYLMSDLPPPASCNQAKSCSTDQQSMLREALHKNVYHTRSILLPHGLLWRTRRWLEYVSTWVPHPLQLQCGGG